MFDQQGGRGDCPIIKDLSNPLSFTLNQRAVGSMQLRLGVEFAKRAFRLPNKAGGLLSPLTRNRAQNYRRDVSSIAHPFSNDGAACSPQYLEAGLS